METKIGLIAGNGRFPLIFAREARKKGAQIIAIAIKEETSPDLEGLVDKLFWVGVGELKRLFEIVKEEKLTTLVMAGQVRHKLIFEKGIKLDPAMKALLETIIDRKTDSLIGAVAKKLESFGIKLIDSTTFLSDYLPKKGTLTKREPIQKEWEDINFGREVAKSIAGLDIGQTVVVKEKAVLAVEAIEGTDLAIRRGAEFGKEDVVIVKVSKPSQDMRFDIPVVGPETIELMKEVGASCLAVEAEKTLLIDKDEMLSLADKYGISVVAI